MATWIYLAILGLSLSKQARADESNTRPRCVAALAHGNGISIVYAAGSPRFVFSRAALENILADFSHCNGTPQFRVMDRVSGLRRYSGTFNVDDPESLFQLLSREPGLRLRRRGAQIPVWSR